MVFAVLDSFFSVAVRFQMTLRI